MRPAFVASKQSGSARCPVGLRSTLARHPSPGHDQSGTACRCPCGASSIPPESRATPDERDVLTVLRGRKKDARYRPRLRGGKPSALEAT